MPPDARQELIGIQYLRGIAALMVALFHLLIHSELARFPAGRHGVDIFFVISGFIMWVTTAGRDIGPAGFIARRLVRIVPLYWLVTGLTIAATVLKPQFMQPAILSARNIVGSLLFVPVVEDGNLRSVVIAGWTLSFEMFFYLCFAAMLPLRRCYRPMLLAALFAGLVLFRPFGNLPILHAMSSPIVLEFVAGVFIGWLWTSSVPVPRGWAHAWLVAGIAGFGIMIAQGSDSFWIVGPSSALIVAGTAFLERSRPIRRLALPELLGNASYSIYLWHTLLYAIIGAVLARFQASDMLRMLSAGVLGVSGAILLYWLIERPMTRRLQRLRRADRRGGRLVPA